MKSYPTIPHWNKGIWGEQVYTFRKYDGSNIRFEWTKKRGWYKFGTRNVLLDPNSEPFGEAVTLFMNKYAEDLERKFKDDKDMRKQLKFMAFCEFLGENSFAGFHEDEPHDVILFDVNQHNKGILPPKEFLNKFGDLDIAELVHTGNYNKEFVNSIKTNTFEDYDFDEWYLSCYGCPQFPAPRDSRYYQMKRAWKASKEKYFPKSRIRGEK